MTPIALALALALALQLPAAALGGGLPGSFGAAGRQPRTFAGATTASAASAAAELWRLQAGIDAERKLYRELQGRNEELSAVVENMQETLRQLSESRRTEMDALTARATTLRRSDAAGGGRAPASSAAAIANAEAATGLLSRAYDNARIAQLAPADVARFPAYYARGLDAVPAQYDPAFSNPCWKANGTVNCLPHFFVLGVAKGGTTALWNMLAAHPNVATTRKEPHWWTRSEMPLQDHIERHYREGIKELRRARRDGNYDMILGDGSASTFWQVANQHFPGRPLVPELIRAVLPDARLVVILRDPIERAVSEFTYFVGDKEKISADHFGALVDARVRDFRACTKAAPPGGENACVFTAGVADAGKAEMRGGTVRLGAGIYSRALEVWWRLFPKPQLLVLRSEDLKADPAGTLAVVFDHLGLAATATETARAAATGAVLGGNARRRDRALPPGAGSSEARAKLAAFYAPFDYELVAMLNDTRFGWGRV